MMRDLRLCSTATLTALAAALLSSVSACSGDDSTSSAPLDAGPDAPLDATTSFDGAPEGSAPEDASGDSPANSSDAGDAGDAGADAGPSPHSACVPGVALDPAGSDPCANTLCNMADDFYCCAESWDLSCAEVAHTLCASECPADPADGGIAKFGGTSHSIAQLTSRDNAVCAVSVEGDVWCWGFEDILGDGSEQQVSFPRKIVGLPATASIAMAGSAICALGVDHAVRCWGRSPAGSTSTPIVTPPSAPTLATASAIAGDRILGTTDSSFLCAVVAGGVQCWGTVDGTLGPGVPNPTATPTPVNLSGVAAPSTQVTSVFAGAEDTCVLVGAGGTPLCWGANTTGMIGHNGFGGTAPVTVPLTCLPASNADGGPDDCANALGGIVKIAIGGGSVCMIDTAGSVWCLGDNSEGQLGTGTAGGAFPYPQKVAGLTASDVTVGATHACAAPLDASAAVVCWGSSASDELGPSASDGGISPSPVPVTGLSGVTALTAATGATCALKADGTVWCWGTNDQNQLGGGTRSALSPTPVQVSFVSFP